MEGFSGGFLIDETFNLVLHQLCRVPASHLRRQGPTSGAWLGGMCDSLITYPAKRTKMEASRQAEPYSWTMKVTFTAAKRGRRMEKNSRELVVSSSTLLEESY